MPSLDKQILDLAIQSGKITTEQVYRGQRYGMITEYSGEAIILLNGKKYSIRTYPTSIENGELVKKSYYIISKLESWHQ